MIIVLPYETPINCGCVAGVVDPPAMNTEEVIVAAFVLLLFSVTVTPFTGAGVGRVTGNGTGCPGATLTPFGSPIVPPPLLLVRLTVAVALTTFGAEAVSIVEPGPTPVTSTFSLESPALKVTLVGTVATPVLVDDKVAVNDVGAGTGKVS